MFRNGQPNFEDIFEAFGFNMGGANFRRRRTGTNRNTFPFIWW